MLYRPKNKKTYMLVLDKVRHEVHPFIWIELNKNTIRLWNRFTGIYHLFENGDDYYKLSDRSLSYLMDKINKDFESGEGFEIKGRDTKSKGSST